MAIPAAKSLHRSTKNGSRGHRTELLACSSWLRTATIELLEPRLLAYHQGNDGPTHQWLTFQAYKLYDSQFPGSELGRYIVGDFFGSDQPSNWAEAHGSSSVVEGSWAEDEVDDDDIANPSLEHFVSGADVEANGTDNLFIGLQIPLVGEYESAYERAGVTNNLFGASKTQYSQNKRLGYWYLGRVAHLIQDLTTPAHVHNDPHHPVFGGDDQFHEWAKDDDNYENYGADAVAPGWRIALPVSLEALFRETADYTEDYASDGRPGELIPEYDVDYRAVGRHLPQDVTDPDERLGDLSDTELETLGKDLLPWAVEQVASLFRLFYDEVDSTGPTALTANISDRQSSPTRITTDSI